MSSSVSKRTKVRPGIWQYVMHNSAFVFLVSATVVAGSLLAQISAPYEPFDLHGPNYGNFFTLAIGEKITLESNMESSYGIVLTNYNTAQLQCITLDPQEGEKVKWECTALGTSFNGGKSELFFYEISTGRRSNSVVIQIEGIAPTVYPEELRLWGPTKDKIYGLRVGESIVLTADARASLNPQLKGFILDQISCRQVPVSYKGAQDANAKWECTALKSGGLTTSKIFFQISNEISNTIEIKVEEANPTIYSEDLALSGPTSSTFERVKVGESIVLIAGAHEALKPELKGYKEDQLKCRQVPASYQGAQTSTAKWECTGLRSGNTLNSEVFFTIGPKWSNTVVIQVDPLDLPDSPKSESNTPFLVLPKLPPYPPLLDEHGNPIPVKTTRGDGAGADHGLGQQYGADGELIPTAGFEEDVRVNETIYGNPFSDTTLESLSGVAAAQLYRMGIIGGYPDGEFKEKRLVNRAEAAKFLLLARFGEIPERDNNGRFPDVLDGEWYTKYVVTAADRGIIDGHPDGTFRPADVVNTVEFLKMLANTFEIDQYLPYRYLDVYRSDWFAAYAGVAKKYKLFPERSQRYLKPGEELTRADVAIAIFRYLETIEEK
jgi:hypothetical protein